MSENLSFQNQESSQKEQSLVSLNAVNNEYQLKVRAFRKRIIFNSCASIFFVIFILSTNFFANTLIKNNETDIQGLKSRIDDLANKSSNIESRINEVKKYKQTWITANQNGKVLRNIKISDINDIFNSMVKKYDLDSPKINISAPEILKDGVYSNQSFEVQLISLTIDFQSLTDRVAIRFLNDFIDQISGYVVINNLDIKKNKQEILKDEDFVNISTGKNIGLVSTKISLSWYLLRDKPEVK